MKTAVCHLKSVSPYSQSRAFQSIKSRDETHDDFEQRCWRERCHADKDGNLFIPPMAFKNCLSEAAKYKSIQIPGKGKATYTKHFEAGVLVVEPLKLPITLDDVSSERLHVPADGRRGGSKRVFKNFPVIHEWEGDVSFNGVRRTGRRRSVPPALGRRGPVHRHREVPPAKQRLLRPILGRKRGVELGEASIASRQFAATQGEMR